jgi:hypothetical protein
MAINPQPQGAQFQVGAVSAAGVTSEMAPRHVVYHPVTSQELDMVASLSNSVHLAFFGAMAGAFVSFWLTLKTVASLTTDDKMMLTILVWVAGVLAAYFLVQSLKDIWTARRTLNDIKQRKAVEH